MHLSFIIKTDKLRYRGVRLLAYTALMCLVISPAHALKYAEREHSFDADPRIPTWVPGPLDIAARQEFQVVGSDTMDEITLEWVKMFRKAYPLLSVTMEARASGTGHSGLIEGRSHIATVAREMLPHEEKRFIEKFGYAPTAFRVATGSAGSLGKTASSVVLVDKDNPIEGLTMAQLDAIYSTTRKRGHPEVNTWGDLGLTGEWEDRPIHLYGLKPPNGIESYFQMNVLQGGDYKTGIEFVKGEGYTHAFTVAAERMADQPGGLSYAMLVNATPNVRVVPLAQNEGEPFVAPTVENVYLHTYPLSRYIYIYVNRAPGTDLEPEIKEFLKVVLSYQGQSAMTREGVFMPMLYEVVLEELDKLD
ncbi:MAG: phosphate transport system substrate-binding protein [Lysobacterales bacterium]|jgi:phosphate transport system substrate-binding protein